MRASQPEASLSSGRGAAGGVFERELKSRCRRWRRTYRYFGWRAAKPPGEVTLTSLDLRRWCFRQAIRLWGAVTVPCGSPCTSGLDGAVPGETRAIRLEAPGYATKERQGTFAAELQTLYRGTQPSCRPRNRDVLELVYAPRIQPRAWYSLTQQPSGVEIKLRATSSNPACRGDSDGSAARPSARISLRLCAGSAEIWVEAPRDRQTAPPGSGGGGQVPIQRRLGRHVRALPGSKLTFRNPRAAATPVTLTSAGTAAVRLGTAPPARARLG